MKNKIIKISILVIIMVAGLVVLTGCTETTNIVDTAEEKKDEIVLVKDKWVKRVNDRDLYLIGTENEVFKVEDNLFIGKFNSGDIYNKIEVGKKYKIKTTGTRSSFMSWYRNINTAEEVKD